MNKNIRWITQTAVMLALLICLQWVGSFVPDQLTKQLITGTCVNGRRIRKRTQVKIDDTIGLGNSEFVFKRGEEFHEKIQTSWFFSKVTNKPSIKPWKLLLLVSLFHIFKYGLIIRIVITTTTNTVYVK